jgi:hypothetical protein
MKYRRCRCCHVGIRERAGLLMAQEGETRRERKDKDMMKKSRSTKG